MNSEQELLVGKREKASPKDVFTHLLAILMLYASAISFLVMMFQIINIKIPDDLFLQDHYVIERFYGLMRGSVAFLVIVYPVYILSTWLLSKSYAKHPEKRGLRIRKWLTYFTLFAASLIIVGNLVSLLSGFLRGELTMRFLLKVLSVFFVALSIFGYYLLDLKDAKRRVLRAIFGGVTTVVLCALVFGFWSVGSPKEQRMRRLDQERVYHLSNLQGSIVSYYEQNQKLPENLAVIARVQTDIPVDPQTGEAYEYEVQGEKEYVLCAVFSRESYGRESSARSKYLYASPYAGDFSHDAGRVCFERSVLSNFRS